MPFRSRISGQAGAASVELVAVLPMLGLALLIAAQVALAGAALWSAGIAARAGARAAHLGREARGPALRALPPRLREGAKVREADAVHVRVAVPELISALPPLFVRARSSLEAGNGTGP